MCIHRGTFHLGGWQHQRVLGLVFAVWLSASSFLLVPSPAAAVGIDFLTGNLSICSIRGAGQDGGIRASATITYSSFFPLVSTALSCQPTAEQPYGTVAPTEIVTNPPAANNPDLNLSMRGYVSTDAHPGLVDYGGAFDEYAPQLYSLFSDNRTATFRTDYRVYDWNPSCNCRGDLISDWPVTLAGLGTAPGEAILTPSRGAGIGYMRTDGFEAMVLYATKTQLTLKYTREDHVVYGYTIHLENVCVDANLVGLYNYWNNMGRTRLPALWAGQPVGRAMGQEVGVAIRDTGSFMDPRSRKDWWQGRQ
jgi:hypothetical protein